MWIPSGLRIFSLGLIPTRPLQWNHHDHNEDAWDKSAEAYHEADYGAARGSANRYDSPLHDSRLMPSDHSFQLAEELAAAEAEAELGYAPARKPRTPGIGAGAASAATDLRSGSQPRRSRVTPGRLPPVRAAGLSTGAAGPRSDAPANRFLLQEAEDEDEEGEGGEEVGHDIAEEFEQQEAEEEEVGHDIAHEFDQEEEQEEEEDAEYRQRRWAATSASSHNATQFADIDDDNATNTTAMTNRLNRSHNNYDRRSALLDEYLTATAQEDPRGGGVDVRQHVPLDEALQVYERWLVAVERIMRQEKLRVIDIFNRFQHDGASGGITREHFFEGLATMGLDFTPSEVHIIVNELDRNSANQVCMFGVGVRMVYFGCSSASANHCSIDSPERPGAGTEISVPGAAAGRAAIRHCHNSAQRTASAAAAAPRYGAHHAHQRPCYAAQIRLAHASRAAKTRRAG